MSLGEVPNRFAEHAIPETVLGQNHKLVFAAWSQVIYRDLGSRCVLDFDCMPVLGVHQSVPDVVLDCGTCHAWKKGEMLNLL